MPTKLLHLIPARRRDRLFAKIRRMVNEIDAVDRSLESVGEEGIAIDEALETMCSMFRREAKRVKKASLPVAA